MKALPAVALTVALASIDASAGGVDFRDIVVKADGERLTTELWYPTDEPSGRMTLGPFSTAAAPEALPGAGPHGVVLISHGTGGGRLNHRGTAIRLAEAGYKALRYGTQPHQAFPDWHRAVRFLEDGTDGWTRGAHRSGVLAEVALTSGGA